MKLQLRRWQGIQGILVAETPSQAEQWGPAAPGIPSQPAHGFLVNPSQPLYDVTRKAGQTVEPTWAHWEPWCNHGKDLPLFLAATRLQGTMASF